MKIVSITMVKNESDIIESFIRYTVNIVDEMIILDNGSTDDTLKIINGLIDENLPVVLLYDEDSYYNQDVKMTRLLKTAVYDYDGDFVCVVDCDEFITSDNSNPKELLKNLSASTYYQVKWRTYVLTGGEDESIKFIPQRLNHIRDDDVEYLYKVIVPAEIVRNYDVSLEMGNHNLVFNCEKTPKPDRSLDLKVSHFPIRSKHQCMSKILVGWPNVIPKYMENNGYGVHWKLFFDEIKKNGTISDEDLKLFTKNYSFAEFKDNIPVKYHPMNTDFCRDIEIRYDYNYNYLANILDNYVYLTKENISLKKQIEIYENSTSWKLTRPLRALSTFIKNLVQ